MIAANLGPNPITGPAESSDSAPSPAIAPGDNSPNGDERQRALAVVALCVGGMVLARAVDDEPAADELRAASHRYAVALAGWE
jgi:hypothetical protein